MNKYCPMMSHRHSGIKECRGSDCAWWEEMADSCSVKAQQRHIRAWSMGLTELGMALVDILRADQEERE